MENVKIINVNANENDGWIAKFNMDNISKLDDKTFKEILKELINFKYPQHTDFRLHKSCKYNNIKMIVEF